MRATTLAAVATALQARTVDDLIVRYRTWLRATRSCCGHPSNALETRRCQDSMPNVLRLVKCRVCRRTWVDVQER